MIGGRFATARELAFAAALALAVFGPSLVLARDYSPPTEAEGSSRLPGCVSGGDGQPTDPGLDEMPRLPSDGLTAEGRRRLAAEDSRQVGQGPVRTLRK
jgi:hypothetical protein